MAKRCLEPNQMGLAVVTISGNSAVASVRESSAESTFHDSHWYAIYTWANHEKRVAREIAAHGIEHYLPVYRSLRRWNDRRVELELPLFPGYVFARLPLRDKVKVLQVPSVVRFVGFSGQPTALPDDEFDILRAGLAARACVEPCPFLNVGSRVRIIAGPFAGLTGVLKRKKRGLRVVLSLELIQQSISVEVDQLDLASL